MPLLTGSAAGILSPEEVGALVVQPVARASVGYQVSQRVVIRSHTYRFPELTEDPKAS